VYLGSILFVTESDAVGVDLALVFGELENVGLHYVPGLARLT
jgi:hypothetical protein